MHVCINLLKHHRRHAKTSAAFLSPYPPPYTRHASASSTTPCILQQVMEEPKCAMCGAAAVNRWVDGCGCGCDCAHVGVCNSKLSTTNKHLLLLLSPIPPPSHYPLVRSSLPGVASVRVNGTVRGRVRWRLGRSITKKSVGSCVKIRN